MCALVTALTSVFLSALLSSQVPLNPVQSEEKLAPPSALQSDTEAEKQLIREEYEERLARLRADYEAEQESRARLEEDITAMRNSYDVKVSTLEENLRKETGGCPAWLSRGWPAGSPPHFTDVYRALPARQAQF